MLRLAVLLSCLAPSTYGFLTTWNHTSALYNGLPSGNAHVVSFANDLTKMCCTPTRRQHHSEADIHLQTGRLSRVR